MATKNLTCTSTHSILKFIGATGGQGGNSNDDHLPLGLYDISFTYYFFRAFLKFSLDFSDVISITKAELHIRTSDGTHVGKDATSVDINRVTSSWTGSGGVEGNWTGSPDWDGAPSVTSSGKVTRTLSKTTNYWNVLDITAIVQAWFTGSANYGIRMKMTNEAYPSNSNTPEANELRSLASSSDPYIVLTYVDNTAPTAPTQTGPAAGAVTSDSTPDLAFTHNDADGDPLVTYDLQVSTDATFASVTHWDLVNSTVGIVGNDVTRTYAGTALTRGTTYYWRARTNDGTVDGAWSAARSFIYNSLPTVVRDAPTASTLAAIHNLADLALWTSGGSHAKPVFKFTPSDAQGGNLTKYRLRIYDAAAAGNTVYDSGEVSLTMPSGTQVAVNCSQALVNGTEYWWTIDVYDGLEWAGESSRTAFKVRWAQGLFEYDTGGTSSTNWAMATGTITEDVAVIFRSATSSGGDTATGKTAFFADIGSVAVQQWLQVLVRLSTDTAGTDGSLADMTFSYYGTPNTPDGWSVS